MREHTYCLEVGGKKITAEFTDLAENANGSVLMRSGETVVLVAAVMSSTVREGAEKLDFVPLTVDYEERFYAAGDILGSSFVRREGKPSEEAVLTARMVDRAIRPLFDARIRADIQVVALVLSLGERDPDALALIGASLALGASDIPWNGPLSAVRIAGGSAGVVVNPSYAERSDAAFGAVVCGKGGLLTMLEFGGREIAETGVVAALEGAQKELAKIEAWQAEVIKERGKGKRALAFPEVVPEAARAAAEREGVRRGILGGGKRPDGRGADDLRPIRAARGGISQTLHGSGTFYRGKTHVLSVLTRAPLEARQTIETIEARGGKKFFIHHYNSFPFGGGETGRLGPNRRAIGHGALAERALAPVVPSPDTYPHTLRLVSEALSADGSTSMASVCAATLALQDGKVPITAPVAGVAMGLVSENNEHTILTDISGEEDHWGDMDFKVAGTEHGITALQMDVKVEGVPLSLLTEALAKARVARTKILEAMR